MACLYLHTVALNILHFYWGLDNKLPYLRVKCELSDIRFGSSPFHKVEKCVFVLFFLEYRDLIPKHCVVSSHGKTIWSPRFRIYPEVFLARWRTNPFICMACYTSLHLPQD